MDKNETVCFSGYRPEKMPQQGNEATHEIELIKFRLGQAIQEAVVMEQRRHFIVGMAEGLDMWAGEAVADFRDMCQGGITLEAAVPFPKQGEKLRGEARERYIKLLGRADKMTLISERYYGGVFHARNRYMVDNSGLLICYYDGKPGGTKYTLEYARKKELKIVNIKDINYAESLIIKPE